MRRSSFLAEAAARCLARHQRRRTQHQHDWIGGSSALATTSARSSPSQHVSRRAVASSASSSASASSLSQPALTEQSPFWTLCGVVAIGVSAAAVGQRAACADERAARAELRNAAAEAYAAERRSADALARQLSAAEGAARHALEEEEEHGGAVRRRRRPWREVSEEVWAAMSDRREG